MRGHIHTRAHGCTPHKWLSPTASLGRVPVSHGFSFAHSRLSSLLLLEVGTSYYAVAVVKRGSRVTINTLKGMKSCHTGINRTVGWNVPVGYLVESGRLSVMGCDVLKGEGFLLQGLCCCPSWDSLPPTFAAPPSRSSAILLPCAFPDTSLMASLPPLLLAGLVLLPLKFLVGWLLQAPQPHPLIPEPTAQPSTSPPGCHWGVGAGQRISPEHLSSGVDTVAVSTNMSEAVFSGPKQAAGLHPESSQVASQRPAIMSRFMCGEEETLLQAECAPRKGTEEGQGLLSLCGKAQKGPAGAQSPRPGSLGQSPASYALGFLSWSPAGHPCVILRWPMTHDNPIHKWPLGSHHPLNEFRVSPNPCP